MRGKVWVLLRLAVTAVLAATAVASLDYAWNGHPPAPVALEITVTALYVIGHEATYWLDR